MTDNTQELDEILSKLARDTTLADRAADIATTPSAVNDASKRYQWSLGDAKQSILDWHNKQIEAVIKKPHILPKNAQHQESVKQGINFYHRQMRKRIDKLKEGK